MPKKTITRRYKDFEVTANPDGSAVLKMKDLPEILLDSFTWMQFKASIKEGKFDPSK